RGQIDDAAAAIISFALRQSGLSAENRRHGDKGSAEGMEGSTTIRLICYASHPSEAVRRYTLRKLSLRGGARLARHLVIDYDLPRAPAPTPGPTGAADTFAGDVAALCRLVG